MGFRPIDPEVLVLPPGATSGRRIELDPDAPEFRFWTGNAAEVEPGGIFTASIVGPPPPLKHFDLIIEGPGESTDQPRLTLSRRYEAGADRHEIELLADDIVLGTGGTGQLVGLRAPIWANDGDAVAMIAQSAVETTAQNNIGSGAYAAGSVSCSLTFNGPPSGRIEVWHTINWNCPAGERIRCDFEIRETNASGTVIRAASDTSSSLQSAVQVAVTQRAYGGDYVEGLTPGQVYFIRTMHRKQDAGTCDVTARRLGIVPLL